MQNQANGLAAAANQQPGLAGVFSMFRANTPQLFVDVDREKCKRLGVPLSDVFGALQTFLGGYYVNDFNAFGRTWQVNLQARADFRDQAAKVRRIEVRNDRGEMVPLGTLAAVRDSTRPDDDHPLQQRRGGRDQRLLVAGHQFGPGRADDG